MAATRHLISHRCSNRLALLAASPRPSVQAIAADFVELPNTKLYRPEMDALHSEVGLDVAEAIHVGARKS